MDFSSTDGLYVGEMHCHDCSILKYRFQIFKRLFTWDVKLVEIYQSSTRNFLSNTPVLARKTIYKMETQKLKSIPILCGVGCCLMDIKPPTFYYGLDNSPRNFIPKLITHYNTNYVNYLLHVLII